MVEKCLGPFWSDIVYLTSAKKFTTIEVRFSIEKKARQHSTYILKKIEELVLLMYLREEFLKIKIKVITPEIDPNSFVAATIIGLEDKITILQATSSRKKISRNKTSNW